MSNNCPYCTSYNFSIKDSLISCNKCGRYYYIINNVSYQYDCEEHDFEIIYVYPRSKSIKKCKHCGMRELLNLEELSNVLLT